MKPVAEVMEEIGWETRLADLSEAQVLTLLRAITTHLHVPGADDAEVRDLARRTDVKAVIEALLNQQSAFARTPKTGSEGKSIRSAVKRSYLGARTMMPPCRYLEW